MLASEGCVKHSLLAAEAAHRSCCDAEVERFSSRHYRRVVVPGRAASEPGGSHRHTGMGSPPFRPGPLLCAGDSVVEVSLVIGNELRNEKLA
jgi:hypothetical protein